MLVTKKKYQELKDQYDVALKQMNKMETIIEYVDEVCKAWHLKKVGNLRAISTIAKLFNPKDSGNEK
tara:strand:+ start:529 stop:729 length:201 start_codon:yes stop_codon:yes gene_type:complete